MKQKKVMFITTVPETLFFAFEEQIPFMMRNGFIVHTMTSAGSWIKSTDVEKKYGTRNHIVNFKRTLSPFHDFIVVLKVFSVFLHVKPDIIHASTPKASLLALIGGMIARVPFRIYLIRGLVYQNQSGIRRQFWHFLEKTSCLLSHKVLVNSVSNRMYIVNNAICKEDKIGILGNGSSHGIDFKEKFNPEKLPVDIGIQLRRKADVPVNSVVFGFTGRIVRDKGIVDLTEAWKQVVNKMRNATLVLVGQVNEPRDMLPLSCMEYIKNEPSIRLVDDSINARIYYSMMDIFVFPSYREGFPNVVLEANAMNLPVITTNALGCRDAVEDMRNGLTYDVGNVQQLAEMMIRLYEDEALRTMLGRSARSFIIEKYDPEIICKALLQLVLSQNA